MIQKRLEAIKKSGSTILVAAILACLVIALIIGFKAQPVTWEYKITSVPDLSFKDSMTDIGNEGWELVFARRAKDSTSDDFSYECIFKRPKR